MSYISSQMDASIGKGMDESDAFNKSQITNRSPQDKLCVVCDGSIKGMPSTSCPKCRRPLHEDCREAKTKDNFCPGCKPREKATSSTGSRQLRHETCYRCKQKVRKSDCEQMKKSDDQLVNVCKTCIDSIKRQKAEAARIKAPQNASEMRNATTSNAMPQVIEGISNDQGSPSGTQLTEHAIEVPSAQPRATTSTHGSIQPTTVTNAELTGGNSSLIPENLHKSRDRGSKHPSSVSSRTKIHIQKLEEEQASLKRTIEMCNKKLMDLEKTQMAMKSRSGSSKQSSVSLSDTEILNKTNEWLEKSTKTDPPKVQFSTQTQLKSMTDNSAKFTKSNIRASTPSPWLEARTFEEFSTSLREPSSERKAAWERGYCRLSQDQIYSRQVIPKELPAFSGDPQDWPIFISSFAISSKRCGYSDEENVLRLRHALRGDALEAVKTQLRFPEMLVEILNTLRIKYGRPDQILDSVLERIHKAPALTTDNLEQLIDFSLLVRDLYATIKASKMEDHLRNPMLLRELVGKLSGSLQMQWGQFKRSAGAEDVYTFGQWVFDLADIASELPGSKVGPTKRESPRTHAKKPMGRVYTIEEHSKSSNQLQCPVCSKSHDTSSCPNFLVKSPDDRWNLVMKLNLCGKCLRKHNFRLCRQKRKCSIDGCVRTHHFLIHGHKLEGTVKKDEATRNEPHTSGATEALYTHGFTTSEILFRIVPVRLYGKEGTFFETFAFLDEGSSITLLDQEIADILEIDGPQENLCLKWTGDTTRTETNSRRVAIKISGGAPGSKCFTISDVRTVSGLNLQTQSFDATQFVKKASCLRNVSVPSYKDATPRILIGLAHWTLALPTDIREDAGTGIIATKSKLGWAVSGVIGKSKVREALHAHVCECTHDEDLHKAVKNFFSIEYFGVRSSRNVIESKENERAKSILNRSLRKVGKRYEVALLWKHDEVRLPESRQMAFRRMICLEKKLVKDETMYTNLRGQIADYVEKGYARRLTPTEEITKGPRTWYLPLFAVSNPNKPAKIRMVWDAAAKVERTSLNDHLLTGPDYLNPLPDVLRRFRQFQYAVSGDIREMFHQVRICKEDQNSQRFLWRNSPKDEVETYVMCVMTFGATCSPSAAQFVKNTNAQMFQKDFPRAVEAIVHNHYVDDYVDSFPTKKEAVDTTNQVVQIHSYAGFDLRNFVSNTREVLEATGTSTNPAIKNLDTGESQGAKILCMFWDVAVDSLVFKVHVERIDPELLNGSRKPTKRELLRILMMVFDPLGLIAHILVQAKILLQDVWRTNVGWDEQIQIEQMRRWLTWIKLLNNLERVEVPRCYHPALSQPNPHPFDLHVFVDASENAFAAVAYFRIELSNSQAECTLVGAKTKVAPQKPLSIPRMELQAAVLGTRLAESLSKAHVLRFRQRVFWSDSTTVLGWINSEARQFKPFVAFRVGEILENSESSEWRYVPTKLNVADIATKWRPDVDDSVSNQWFNGPEFLRCDESQWPKRVSVTKTTSDEEIRRVHHVAAIASINPNPYNISSWRILVRSQVQAVRAINLFMLKIKNVGNTKPLGPFTAIELKDAESELIRSVQNEHFPVEKRCLTNGKDLPNGSSLLSLSPILDDEGLLRMKGRLNNQEIPTNYPIILPRDHKITHLIMKNMHHRYHHHNHETVINETRQLYWIPKLRTLAKRIRNECNFCKRQNARPSQPLEADLPKMRLAVGSRPFTYTGLDYFGPVEVVVGRRREKRWVALFTCLTVRGIHLEVAHTLTANSATMCLRRFIARRGLPYEIWSDNGSNFRKASSDLKNALSEFSPEQVAMSFDNVRWKFIPPLSPNMGGAWERLVRSVKNTLGHVLPNVLFNDEQLLSALAEVEHIINSRPLTYMPVEPDALEALTPNHLILGSSSGSKTPGIFPENELATRNRYIKTQQFADSFWRRWVLEYLPTITRRTKWCKPCKPINIGDIGFIWDAALRNSWKMGKVVDVVHGANHQVRQIVIQTATGLIRRPASKFAVLDVLPAEIKEGEPQCL